MLGFVCQGVGGLESRCCCLSIGWEVQNVSFCLSIEQRGLESQFLFFQKGVERYPILVYVCQAVRKTIILVSICQRMGRTKVLLCVFQGVGRWTVRVYAHLSSTCVYTSTFSENEEMYMQCFSHFFQNVKSLCVFQLFSRK